MLLGSATFFAVMALLTKAVAPTMPSAEIALVRWLVGFAAVGVALGLGAQLRPRRWGWLLVRGFAGGLAVVAYFACIAHVPVGIATLLNYTAPVFTMLFSWWLLGERPRPRLIIGLALTLVGVTLVVGVQVLHFRGGVWELVGALSAVGSGLAVTGIRGARRAEPDGRPPESTWSVFLSFNVLGFLVTVPFVAPPWGTFVLPPDARTVVLLLLMGLCSLAAQLCMTYALAFVTGPMTGLIHELTIVLTLLGGALLLHELPTPLQLVGVAITVGGVGWTAFAAPRAPNKVDPP